MKKKLRTIEPEYPQRVKIVQFQF